VVNHLIKKFDSVDDVALACVYFNYKDGSKTTPKDVIRNLLKQFWERTSTLSTEAKELYALHQQRQTEPGFKELLSLLRNESGTISRFFIVIDALDEFDDTRNARATLLLELCQIPTVRVLITGRIDVQRTVLSTLQDNVVTFSIRASNNDIRQYLDGRIEKAGYLGEELKSDKELRTTVIERIVDKANGMYFDVPFSIRVKSDNLRFLVAALQLQLLEEQPNRHRILQALNQLPTGLGETYDAALSRIARQQPLETVELALKTLLWITFAREQLEAGALQHALAVKESSTDIVEIDLPDLQVILSACAGLVAIESESGKIRLVHETTQQYLQHYFHNRKKDGDAEIAKVCLRYFCLPAFSRAFENEKSLNNHLQKYKLSSYASRNCFIHIFQGGLEAPFVPEILNTFENQGTRDSVFQIAEYVKTPYYYDYGRLEINLLQLASMHGLVFLCRKVLEQCSPIQKL